MITSFGSGPLSNFYWSPTRYQGVDYATVEHAFQAAKSLNPANQMRISLMENPSEAKRFGRSIPLRPDWEAIKLQVMRDLLRLKFNPWEPTPYFANVLLGTGDQTLVEGNTWGDTYWGQSPLGTGHNWLGFLLMGVRAELRSGDWA